MLLSKPRGSGEQASGTDLVSVSQEVWILNSTVSFSVMALNLDEVYAKQNCAMVHSEAESGCTQWEMG